MDGNMYKCKKNKLAVLILATVLMLSVQGAIFSYSFQIGGGYAYSFSRYSFLSSQDGALSKGIEKNHSVLISAAGYLGRYDTFGLGLDIEFRFPQEAYLENASSSLPWSFSSDFVTIARTPMTRNNVIGIDTKLGAGINLRNSDASCYPAIRTGGEKVFSLDVELVTGIGLYAEISDTINISAGVDLSVPLLKYYRLEGKEEDGTTYQTPLKPFENPSGYEAKAYVTCSYIFSSHKTKDA